MQQSTQQPASPAAQTEQKKENILNLQQELQNMQQVPVNFTDVTNPGARNVRSGHQSAVIACVIMGKDLFLSVVEKPLLSQALQRSTVFPLFDVSLHYVLILRKFI